MSEVNVRARLEFERQRISNAARRAQREPRDVTIVAVSKKQSIQAIREAYEAGQRDFGENYVQELVEKAKELQDLPALRWHMIGHLQTNKCRFVAGLVERVHTVATVKVVNELARRLLQEDLVSPASPLGVLVEVNIAQEESKSGCRPSDLAELLQAIDGQKNLKACGLMMIAPASKDPKNARRYFDQLAYLRGEHGGAARLPELSMGMSRDAEEAVAAGATHVRIGSAIFGPRGV